MSTSAEDGVAQAEQYLAGVDEDGLDRATSAADPQPDVEGVTELTAARPH